MDEPWRSLKVGDRIRLVRMPSEFALPGYYLHPDTRQAYQTLIDRRRPVRIAKIDEWGIPWINFQIRLPNGSWECHSLDFNHDGWVRVTRRSRDHGQK